MEKKHEMKLVLTGGHARSTAYAVIQEIQARNKGWDIHWIGPKSLVEGKKVTTFDKTFSNYDVSVHSIVAGRVQKRFTFWTIPSLLKIPIGFFHSFLLLLSIKPDVILSFGGFAAFPVVIVGWLLGIPVIVHEQTIAAGRANIYSTYFADKIALSRDESRKYFPKGKSVVTGNPVSKEIKGIKIKPKMSKPVHLFITGGASGSKILNDTIGEMLEELLNKYEVTHQTGELQYAEFKRLRGSLKVKLRNRYEVVAVISKEDWHNYLERSDLVISRAGANITSEIMVTKRPAIFIPIPWSYHNEQAKNAQEAVDFGIAKIIRQNELDPNILAKSIVRLIKQWPNIYKKVNNKECIDTEASGKLVDILEDYKDGK